MTMVRIAVLFLAAVMIAFPARADGSPSAAERARQLEQDASLLTGRAQGETLARAGRAWLLAGQASRAFDAQTRALTVVQNDAALWVDRSFARRLLGRPWEAMDDLHRALDLDPRHVEALVFRAELYRAIGQMDLAFDDLDRALALEPRHPEALYHRGALRRLAGDWNGARADWRRLMLESPHTPAALSAHTALSALEQSTAAAKPAATESSALR
jgi:tetratricopeptide (TPR) repeat protein